MVGGWREGVGEGEEVAMRRSWILIERSTLPVAMRWGWYLFQSRERTSVGWAVREREGTPLVDVGDRVSQILRKPSEEQEAMVVGCEGEKLAA